MVLVDGGGVRVSYPFTDTETNWFIGGRHLHLRHHENLASERQIL